MKSLTNPGLNSIQLMELAVPAFSFGGAAVAILFDVLGIPLDFHYPAFGCVIASIILAYLAWLRPKKDIVAISTPIYSIIFFIVPGDFSIGILLQLLYAVSLTALLIRLKYRFGSSASHSCHTDESGPLGVYVSKVTQLILPVSPPVAGDAGTVFIRFAHGEYEAAARLATARSQELSKERQECDPLAVAFAIVAEQAAHTSTDSIVLDEFKKFSPEEFAFLYNPADNYADREQEYATSLDNALLLLYAVALCDEDNDRKNDVSSCQQFARKIAGDT